MMSLHDDAHRLNIFVFFEHNVHLLTDFEKERFLDTIISQNFCRVKKYFNMNLNMWPTTVTTDNICR